MAALITKQLLAGALALGAALVPAHAASIQYNFNQVQGLASVTGYISTDATLGVIGASHITDWMLVLNDGSSTDTLSGAGKLTLNAANSAIAGFTHFTATASALQFNFSDSDRGLIQLSGDTSFGNYLAFDAYWGGAGDNSYKAISWVIAGAQNQIHYDGLTTVAVLAVPEPATYGMLLAGLLLLAVPLRRRSGRNHAPR